MRAIRFERAGGPEVMQLHDMALPEPGPGQVRIRHRVIGVNFIDTYHRSGLYPVPLPSGLGSEAVGVVEALGEGVADYPLGARVGYAGGGPLCAYAEASVVSASRLIRLPEGISDEVAAASLLKGMTAQYLLKRTFAVQPGQTILFHSAAGGVGLIAGQWAKYLGARVIGTAGAPEKIALALQHGYDHVLNIRDPDWVQQLRALAPDGVPVVYDSVGKDTWDGSLACLAKRGLMVSFGNSSGAVAPFEPGRLSGLGSLYLTRPTLVDYTASPEDLQQTADDLFAVIQNGAVRIAIHQRFALAEAAQAHTALAARSTTGATILIP